MRHQRLSRDDRRRKSAFHVRAAAPVQHTIHDLAAEGVDCPRAAVAFGDDIGVTLQDQQSARTPRIPIRDDVQALRRDF